MTALVQRRLGIAGTRFLLQDLVPSLEVVLVDQRLHENAVSAFLSGLRRRVSLVDCASFEVMRRRGIERAFAFDSDLAAQSFETTP